MKQKMLCELRFTISTITPPFWPPFLPRDAVASAVSGVVILSLCLSVLPSVCRTRALWQNQTMHCEYFATARKGIHSSFLTLTVVDGLKNFRLKFAIRLKLTHPVFKTHRLWQISASQ